MTMSGGEYQEPANGGADEPAAEPPESIWSRLLFRLAVGACAVSLVTFVVAAAGAALFFVQFYDAKLGAQSSVKDWADFSGAIMPMFQTVVAFATLAAAVVIGVSVNAKLETRRRKDEDDRQTAARRVERHRELIRLSEMMVDTNFYVKVTYPAWEVALKWLGWQEERGDKYRAQVVAGELKARWDVYLDDPDFFNFLRTHPHNQPYDVAMTGHPACAIAELPESLAFATWVRFWRHIMFLLDEGILDRGGVRKLFREWYLWWAPFMAEYLAVTTKCLERLGHKVEEHCALARVRHFHTDVIGLPLHDGYCSPKAFDEWVDERVEAIVPYLEKIVPKPEAAEPDATAPCS